VFQECVVRLNIISMNVGKDHFIVSILVHLPKLLFPTFSRFQFPILLFVELI